MSRTKEATFAGLIVLFLMAAGITVVAYLSFIIPEYRNKTFYAALMASCIAELVFFGYLAYTLAVKDSVSEPDPATRIRLMTLIAGWTVAILVTSGFAVHPRYADTFFSDKLTVIQLVITFLLFASIFFQHRQSVGVQTSNAAPQQERRMLESYTGGLDALLADLRSLAASQPNHVVALDGLSKRIDTLRTQVASASANRSSERNRPVSPADIALIEEKLHDLHDEAGRLLSATGETLAEQLQKTRSAADRALSALRQREDAITF